MPTITIDKNDLMRLIGKKVDDDTLMEKIPMMGTELESFGEEMVVEVFPDRPDMLSVEGFALALQGFLGIKTGLYDLEVNESQYIASIDGKVKKVRPDAVCAVVKDVELNDAAIRSLMQVQEKLHLTHGRNRRRVAIGVHDLDKIDFPVHYTTMPKDYEFIPLECNEEMTLEEILQKHKKGVEYKHLLEKYEEYPIWIDSKEQVLSMPPIINSEYTKVTESTKSLFIDITGYGLKYLKQALNILIMSLSIRNGKIYSVKVKDVDGEYTYPDIIPKKMEIDVNYTNRILGINLSLEEIVNFLKRMRYGIEGRNILIPAYRADIMHKIDIVEDVAIAYGFNNFKPEIPNISTIAEEDPFEKFIRMIRNLMTGFQLMEVKNYILTNKKDLFEKMDMKEEKIVEMQNALTVDYNVLRNYLIPGIMRVYSINTHYEYPQNIFEIGEVFRVENDTVREETNLCVGISHEKANFTECKEILNSFFKNLDIKYEIEEKEKKYFIEGRAGSILIDGNEIGYIGEIHPRVLSKWSVGMPVAVFEINLNRIHELFRF
ncbi:MAG TPA: phenylalanine--tRNA ligase subunit beta [Methanomicrobia archaeon]|nr:phenylalanine--tRNA ligase subunit beta [Methanomicrobia archaeon]